jgi:hypothetical protein
MKNRRIHNFYNPWDSFNHKSNKWGKPSHTSFITKKKKLEHLSSKKYRDINKKLNLWVQD